MAVARHFFCLEASKPALQPHTQWIPGISLDMEQLKHEGGNLPPISAKNKHVCEATSPFLPYAINIFVSLQMNLCLM